VLQVGRLGRVLGRLGPSWGRLWRQVRDKWPSWAVLDATLAPRWDQRSIQKPIKSLNLFQDRFLELWEKVWNQLARILSHLGHFGSSKIMGFPSEKPDLFEICWQIFWKAIFSAKDAPRGRTLVPRARRCGKCALQGGFEETWTKTLDRDLDGDFGRRLEEFAVRI